MRTLTDEAIEGDEQFTVSISRVPVTSAVLIGANSIHTVTITDDDDGILLPSVQNYYDKVQLQVLQSRSI